jgi:hypothetical protein
VDGANNKWIGTADSNYLWYRNGQETKYHFTTKQFSVAKVMSLMILISIVWAKFLSLL